MGGERKWKLFRACARRHRLGRLFRFRGWGREHDAPDRLLRQSLALPTLGEPLELSLEAQQRLSRSRRRGRRRGRGNYGRGRGRGGATSLLLQLLPLRLLLCTGRETLAAAVGSIVVVAGANCRARCRRRRRRRRRGGRRLGPEGRSQRRPVRPGGRSLLVGAARRCDGRARVVRRRHRSHVRARDGDERVGPTWIGRLRVGRGFETGRRMGRPLLLAMLPHGRRLARKTQPSVLDRTVVFVVVVVVVVLAVGFIVFFAAVSFETGLFLLVPLTSSELQHLELVEGLVELGRPWQTGRLGHPLLSSPLLSFLLRLGPYQRRRRATISVMSSSSSWWSSLLSPLSSPLSRSVFLWGKRGGHDGLVMD